MPDPSTVGVSIRTVDLAKYNPGDTIDLFGTTSFAFSLSGNYGEIESATVYLSGAGDSWNYITNGQETSFTIGRSDLSNGTFVLKLDLITRTGSGSLADAVGAEKFNITQKWVVRIDLSPPQQIVPIIIIEDGFLTLHWPAYIKSNFQSYVVNRTLPNNGRTQTFEIKDKQTTHWRDENYVGAYRWPIEYSVSIVSETGTTTSVPIGRKDPLEADFSFNPSDSTFTFKWKPTKFYGTFKNYKFLHGNGQYITELANINDSIFTYKLTTVRFGGDAHISFIVQSKSEGIPEPWTSKMYQLGTPLPSKLIGNVMFNSYLNSAVAVTEDNKLLELDEQLRPVREIATLESNYMRMPYPGNCIYSYDDDIIYRLKLEDNSKVLYDLSFIDSHTVASNGLICTEYYRPRFQIRPREYTLPVWITRVINPSGGSNIYYEYSNTTSLNAVISEDGKFIWANNKSVFEINGTTSVLVGTLTGIGSFVGFRRDNSDEIMFREGNKINIYNTNTLTLIRTINPPATGYDFDSYDIQTKNMLWTNSGSKIYTVNIETGVTKSIAISSSASAHRMYIVNEFLIYDGKFIKVN